MEAATTIPSGAPPVLDARGIGKSFPGIRAVDDAYLTMQAGEIVGLLGKNGAGKSTLIKVIAGVERPDEGTLELGGEQVELHSPRDAAHHGVALIPQELVDVPRLTVAENIRLGLGYPKRGRLLVDRRRLADQARAVLERVGAEVDPDAEVASLSVAERRLVMIAGALAASELRLLVVDEPTAALTDPEVERFLEVMRGLARQGVAVLFVTHRLDEVLALTDRVVVMRDGTTVAEARTADLDRRGLIKRIAGPESPAPAQPRQRRERRPVGAEVLRVEDLTLDGVVEGASLAVHEGEILGIAGLVGSGRTELCRMIYGAETPSRGTIYVRGEGVRVRSPREALRNGIVLLPEDRRGQGAILDFRVRENITLPTLRRHRRVRGLPFPSRRSETETAHRQVERLAIRASDQQEVRLLSGGNQQKVIFAKWLEHGADVLILDEPTLGIDINGKDDIYAIARRLADEGKAVVFVSSEFNEIEAVCDRAVLMSEGRIVGEMAGDEVTERNLVEACYHQQGAAA